MDSTICTMIQNSQKVYHQVEYLTSSKELLHTDVYGSPAEIWSVDSIQLGKVQNLELQIQNLYSFAEKSEKVRHKNFNKK